MNLLESLRGTITLETTGAEPESTLEEIIQAGIPVARITKCTDLVCQFRIFPGDFGKTSKIINRRGDNLTVVRKKGIYWNICAFLHRYVFLAALLFLLILTLFLPTRIFFIETDGYQTLAPRAILSAAEDCGISFGISRKAIRSEKTKNALLAAMPKLQWAGINTSGCRAVISVRERVITEPPAEVNIVSNIIALQDAYILSATATAGTTLVRPGDTVTVGQTLISGYTDHGLLLRAERASGEILGLTARTVSAVMPSNCRQITGQGSVQRNISLIIRKKRINLWKGSRISDACCGRMYEEYFVSLPGGFQLPIAICVDRYVRYQTCDAAMEEADACSALQHYSGEYLVSQMTAGQILKNHQTFSSGEDFYLLNSSYTCSENIGKEQRE